MIEVGLLPGDKLFYRDQDEFITGEELTRRILDRALFPKLGSEGASVPYPSSESAPSCLRSPACGRLPLHPTG